MNMNATRNGSACVLDDTVEEETDVFLSTALTAQLHLLSFPSTTLASLFCAPGSLESIRFKPVSRRLEAEISVSGNADSLKLRASGWPWRPVQYMLASLNEADGALHMYPVESMLTVEPCLEHLEPAAGVPGTEQPHSNGPTRTIQMQFRRKETEEQVRARLSSHAHLQRVVDDEPWIPLHGEEKGRERLAQNQTHAPRAAVSFDEADDYLARVMASE
jgi:hypothetical protein